MDPFIENLLDAIAIVSTVALGAIFLGVMLELVHQTRMWLRRK